MNSQIIVILLCIFQVIVIPSIAWGFKGIMKNTLEIVKLQTEQVNNAKILAEIKSDVKVLLGGNRRVQKT